jgi:hypothetical protein
VSRDEARLPGELHLWGPEPCTVDQLHSDHSTGLKITELAGPVGTVVPQKSLCQCGSTITCVAESVSALGFALGWAQRSDLYPHHPVLVLSFLFCEL